MPNFLSNRYAQVGIIAFIAAALFMVFQGSDASDAPIDTTAATTANTAETTPASNSTTEETTENNSEEAVNNTAETVNINQADEETTK